MKKIKKINGSCSRIPYLCIRDGGLSVTPQYGSEPDGENNYGGSFLCHRPSSLAGASEKGTNA